MIPRALFLAGFLVPWIFYLDAAKLTFERPGNRYVRLSRNARKIRLGEACTLALWLTLELAIQGPRLSTLTGASSAALVWASVPLVWAGAFFVIWSKQTLGRFFSGLFGVKEGHRLLTHGPYRIVRHPMYLGLLAMLAALALRLDSVTALAVLVAPMAILLRLQVREEEGVFAETMGEEFERYRTRVPALLPRPRRSAMLSLIAAAAVLLGLWILRPAPRLEPRPGPIVSVRYDTLAVAGGFVHYRFEIESEHGVHARGRAREPAGGGRPLQLVVLLDGQEFGGDAVDAIPSDEGTLAAALDYPEHVDVEFPLWKAPLMARRARRAASRAADALALAVDHFSRRSNVDSSRVALVGSSFGVPVATIVASVDPRVDAVALVYGGGDIARLLEANLAVEPRALRRLVSQWGAWALRPIEPTRYIGAIAPRPVVLVSGENDPQVPRESVEALYREAGEPKRIVWLSTEHVDPSDPVLLERLARIAVESLPGFTLSPPAR